jgi:maltooligosyltrehalose trehalohydrolase
VLLDVVYNHFGPEGNYLPALTSGGIFTEAHHTPWGAAVNFDGTGSAAVRELVIENALHWVHEYHIDGLRLDATHEIIDESEPHILQELAARVHHSVEGDRHVLLIAEDERNERQLIIPREEGGHGLDAVWADDFHHQVRRLVAGDDQGYYRNYGGTAADLAATVRRGWYYEGQVYPSSGAPRGTPADDLPPPRFVHAVQNHDQIGNRAHGGRLNHDVSLPEFRAVSALLLLSPYTPLLFMGQEWAASTPFLYFTDHPVELGRLVTAGRREEFKHFPEFADPEQRAAIPDPQAEETFSRSVLRWGERDTMPHAGVLALYRELVRIRRSHPALRARARSRFFVAQLGEHGIALRRSGTDGTDILLACAFRGGMDGRLDGVPDLDLPADPTLRTLLWTEEERFAGSDAAPAPTLDGGSLRFSSPGALVMELTR